MITAIIYARQSSSDSETFSESVELQKEKCRELAKKEKLTVIDEFEDLNTSGKTKYGHCFPKLVQGTEWT